MINRVKLLLVMAFLTFASCNFTKDNTLEQYPLFREFLVDFERLLELEYGKHHERDLFLMYVLENDEIYPAGICLDSINNLFKYIIEDSLWIPVEQKNGGSIYFLNFNGWFCNFLEELKDIEPWIAEYRANVCSAGDITPSSYILILDHVKTSDLKNEKLRFLIAVHFFSIMIDKGCLDNIASDPAVLRIRE